MTKGIPVYQYQIIIKPDEFMEADKARAIVRTKRRVMEECLGTYFLAGNQIFTLALIEEPIEITTNFRGSDATIRIDTEVSKEIMLDDAFVNKENTISQMIINCVINQAFRETDLK